MSIEVEKKGFKNSTLRSRLRKFSKQNFIPVKKEALNSLN